MKGMIHNKNNRNSDILVPSLYLQKQVRKSHQEIYYCSIISKGALMNVTNSHLQLPDKVSFVTLDSPTCYPIMLSSPMMDLNL